MDTKNDSTPKRRFPGFEGEWEEKKLGEVVEKFDNLRIPVASKDRIAGNVPYYGANGIQDYVEGFTHDGEFVLLAEDGANDLNDYPVQYVNGKVWVNNHAHVIQGRINLIDNKFLLFAIKQIQMEPYLVGGGRAKLNAEIMMNLPLTAPDIEEQRMIGVFLMKVEKQISLQQQKLDKLKNLKKAYLAELFPAEGERVPKRRFPGFEGEWEKTRLSKVAEIEGGGTPSTAVPEYWDGAVDWYTPAEIGDEVFVNQSIRKITDLGLQKSSAKMLPVGTVLFTSRAGIGKTAILAREGCTNQGFQSIIPKEGLLDSYFIYSLSNKLKSYGERIGAGSTFVEVSGKQMSKMSLIIPSIFEQKQIGNFFKKLDQSISLQQQKLDKLNDLKKAYLNELFV